MRYRRSKMAAAASGVIATALAIGIFSGPPAHADAPRDAVPTTGAVFNDPTGTEDEQYAIRDHIMGLVESTEPGETISVSLSNVTDDERGFADSLVAAADRGVKVRAVLSGPTSDTGAAKAIVDGLGTDKDKDSWAIVCSSGCHGSKINHNKFYTFSNVGGKADVVVQSSANFTISNSKTFWNNAVTFVGNTELYDGYADYFEDLSRNKKDSSYYTTHNAGDVKSYHFPRSGQGDTVANTLGNVACGNDDDPTRIRIGMWYFGRPAVADELVRLGKAGCNIQIAYTIMTEDVESILSSASNVATRHLPEDGDYIIHSKYYLIDGPYADVDRKVVFTGSHNFSESALRKNDETLLRIYSEEIHDQYAENFDNIFDTNGGNGTPYSPKQA